MSSQLLQSRFSAIVMHKDASFGNPVRRQRLTVINQHTSPKKNAVSTMRCTTSMTPNLGNLRSMS